MKLGFIARNDLAGLEEDAKFAAEHGFDGLEFNFWAGFTDVTADTIKQMRDILDRYGVACSSMGLWGWNHTAPDAQEREISLGHLDRAIEFAQTLGAYVFITGGGQIPGATMQENVAEFVKVFPPYVARIKGAGMLPAFYAVHGNSFFDSIQAYEAVWEQMPEIGIKLDPANIKNHGDDYLPWLRNHGDKVFEMHIKEHIYMDGKLVSQPAAGMGDIEWGKVMAFLYEYDYQGYLVFEPHGPLWGRGALREKMLLLTKRYLEPFLI
jgi:sugar phosphate isomerase/epimerase